MESSLLLEAPRTTLTDGEIILRPFVAADAGMIERVRTDETINRWMSILPRPAEEFLRWADEGERTGSILFFAICEEGDDSPRGGVATSGEPDLRAGMGYWLLPEHRGRGLATRALRLLSAHLLEDTACMRCELWVDAENAASRRVAERAGYRFEGLLRSYAIVHGRRADTAFYALLPADVKRSTPAAGDPSETQRVRISWYDGPRHVLRPLFELADDSPAAVGRTIELGRVLVARLGDEQVAGHLQLVAACRGGAFEITSLAVAEPHRRRGVGRALVERALAVCRTEKASVVSVSTATADIANVRFYQRCGFRPTAIVADAFTPSRGYPAGLTADGIPVRDAIRFEHRFEPRTPDSLG
jgi:RimJ/RimL family protein N-acetyltransferase